MRQALVVVHRWFGLFTAVFLFLAGSTGAVIGWDHELDAWLNPEFSRAKSNWPEETSLPEVLALADAFEAANPEAVVRYLPLQVPPGHTLSLYADARTGVEGALPYDNVMLDPRTGEEQGRRKWGEAALTRANLMPFLYRFHYSLHLPQAGLVDFGVLLMGIVAIVWVFDGLVALALSFPNRAQWRKSFAFRVRAGGYRLVFDIHRSGGVWTWLLLLTLAITAVSMNLREQVMRPLVSLFSDVAPSVFTMRTPVDPGPRIARAIPRASAILAAEKAARSDGIEHRVGSIFHAAAFGAYGVGFFPGYEDHGDGDLGPSWVYVDDLSGEVLGNVVPGRGSAGDVFLQAQFPLHSGRLGGTFGRVLVTILGLLVAALSATGIVIWLKKRRARAASRLKARSERRTTAGRGVLSAPRTDGTTSRSR